MVCQIVDAESGKPASLYFCFLSMFYFLMIFFFYLLEMFIVLSDMHFYFD